MIEFEIDNKKVEVAEGAMIIEAADAAGIYIPRFCYHKKLSIAANCRMCLVEVEKSKKPLPACATPVTPGMKVFTRSQMAIDAQRAVMEFLLINHPLDCPICDQGGECELQDLSLGYGDDVSRYAEGKRAVADDNLGPLIASEMTRCIQCTRCVRFGSEIAGMPELGATRRGENLEITTYIQHTLKSELSGNIIDICPVGALTSKPFRFKARAWELQQNPYISFHDCVGSNLFVHTRGYEFNDYRMVMRVVPKDNEDINETWLSDRDRFSYEGINSTDRLLTPKIKRDKQWVDVDWTTALNFMVNKLKEVKETAGAEQIAGIASPNSTLEEFFLFQKLLRDIGTNNLDHRIRQHDFSQQEAYPDQPELGLSMPEIEKLDTILVIGSDVRREQPLLCHRIRKAGLKGTKVICINPIDYDLNFKVTDQIIAPSPDLPKVLAGITKAIDKKNSEFEQIFPDKPSSNYVAIAKTLAHCKNGLILLGSHAIQHPQATLIRAICERLSAHTAMTLGTVSEGANSGGAWLSGMLPHRGPAGLYVEKPGLNAKDMLTQSLKAYVLLNLEPELDCGYSASAFQSLTNADFVAVLTPFMSEIQEQYADVLLPIAPFFETGGTFINVCNQWQTFEAVTIPLGDSRPAWKVLRVLGNLFDFEGFDYLATQQICNDVKRFVEGMPKASRDLLKMTPLKTRDNSELMQLSEWAMYQTDNVVRRARSLQEWSQEEDRFAVRINSEVANRYHIQSGELVGVMHDEMHLDLPVIVDDRIAGNVVVVPAGITATAGFAESMSGIELLRGTNSD